MRLHSSEQNLLENFHDFYELLTGKAIRHFENRNWEEALKATSAAAHFAAYYHSGIFSDQRLENILLQIGAKLDFLAKKQSERTFHFDEKTHKPKRILHVVTKLYETGGHSRLITSFIQNDLNNYHSLIITDSSENEIPDSIKEFFQETGGEIVVLSDEQSLMRRASILRRAAQEFDFVILHHHPDDVVVSVAFATDESPPVALMNHADHIFWLGASIADLVLDLRTFGSFHTKERRKARNSSLLPIALKEPEPAISRADAREQLGIGKDQVALLSIGTSYKYQPTKKHNFFSSAKKILERNPQAVMFLIGVESSQNNLCNHERMHCLGIQLNLDVFRQAADIYLEGFPISSFTALLETAALGVCPVLMYTPITLLAAFKCEMSLKDCGERAVDEDDYVEKVSELIRDSNKRNQIGSTVKNSVRDYHSGSVWKRYLETAYNFLEKNGHKPGLIEKSDFLMEKEDLFLASSKNSQLNSLQYPAWLDICSQQKIREVLNANDLLKIFYNSIRIGDTNSPLDILRWKNVIKFGQKSRVK